MAPAHRPLPISELRPGMVVAEDVRTPTGRLLVRAGRSLSAREIHGFELWGVAAVRIESPEPPDPEADEATRPALALPPEQEERLRERFRHLDRADPAVTVLFDYCRHRLARSGAPTP